MNNTRAARFFSAESRTRNSNGEFSPIGETTPDSMAKAYLPLRFRLITRAAERVRNRAVSAADNAAQDRNPLDLSRRLTPVEYAIIRQFARVTAAKEGKRVELDYYPNTRRAREERRTDRTIRNVGIGVGAIGTGYGAWRVGQLAKSSQAAADATRRSADAVNIAAREGVKAARSTRIAAARGYLAIKGAKQQLTTFPTFKRIFRK